jgi:hypothetical protein
MQKLRLVCVLVCVTCLAGCTTFQPLGAPRTGPGGEAQYALTAQVAAGDTLRLTLKDGRQVRAKVSAVSADALDAVPSGDKQSVRYAAADISSVERLDVNARRSAWILGSIGAFLTVSLIAFRNSLKDAFD